MKTIIALLIVLILLPLAACESPSENTTSSDTSAPPPEAAPEEPPSPPAPPVRETFEARPQIALFPRVAGSRPEETDGEGMAYWRTFIDHVLKTSGLVAANADGSGGRAWAIKGIKGLDSIAFFSPLAVEPDTSYRVSFAFRGELPEGGEAGIGVLEFDEFLWIGSQFTDSQTKAHLTGSHDGIRLDHSQDDWQQHAFTFTTSPATHMIHLILFRDGEQERTTVLFDDISVTEADTGQPPGQARPKEES